LAWRLEHALGLLLIRLDAVALALVEVLALPVDEDLLVLALSLRFAHYVPIKKKTLLNIQHCSGVGTAHSSSYSITQVIGKHAVND